MWPGHRWDNHADSHGSCDGCNNSGYGGCASGGGGGGGDGGGNCCYNERRQSKRLTSPVMSDGRPSASPLPSSQESRGSNHFSLQLSVQANNISVMVQNSSGDFHSSVTSPHSCQASASCTPTITCPCEQNQNVYDSPSSNYACNYIFSDKPGGASNVCCQDDAYDQHGRSDCTCEDSDNPGTHHYNQHQCRYDQQPNTYNQSPNFEDSGFSYSPVDTLSSRDGRCGNFIGESECISAECSVLPPSFYSSTESYFSSQNRTNEACNASRRGEACQDDRDILYTFAPAQMAHSTSFQTSGRRTREPQRYTNSPDWDVVPATPGSAPPPPDSPDIVCLAPTEILDITSPHVLPNIRCPPTPEINLRTSASSMNEASFQRNSYRVQRPDFEMIPQTPQINMLPPTPGGLESSCADIFEITPVPSPETIDLCRSSPSLMEDREPPNTPSRPSSPDVVICTPSRNSPIRSEISSPLCPSIHSMATVIRSPPGLFVLGEDPPSLPNTPVFSSTPSLESRPRALPYRSQRTAASPIVPPPCFLLSPDEKREEQRVRECNPMRRTSTDDSFRVRKVERAEKMRRGMKDTHTYLEVNEHGPSRTKRLCKDGSSGVHMKECELSIEREDLVFDTSLGEVTQDVETYDEEKNIIDDQELIDIEESKVEEDIVRNFTQETITIALSSSSEQSQNTNRSFEEVANKTKENELIEVSNKDEENEVPSKTKESDVADIIDENEVIYKTEENVVANATKENEYVANTREENEVAKKNKEDEKMKSTTHENQEVENTTDEDVSNTSDEDDVANNTKQNEETTRKPEEIETDEIERSDDESSPDTSSEPPASENEPEEEKDKETQSEEDNREEGEITGDEEVAINRTVNEGETDQTEGPTKPAERWEKRVRGLGASFIIQEAEEGDAGDEEEEEDGEWIDDEASEATEAAAAAAAAEALRRREVDDSRWRPLRAHSPTVSDIMNRLRLDNMDAENGHSISRFRKPKPVVDQQALLPGITDPSLWMVPCRPTQERTVVIALMRKYIGRAGAAAPEEIRIHSAVFSGSAPRFVYVEALRKQHASAAVHGLESLIRGYDRMKQVPIPEMPDVLKAGRGNQRIREGEWVRPIRGIYHRDAAIVEEVDPTEEFAVVRLLPRVDYTQLPNTSAQRGAASTRGRPRRPRRPPAKRLDVDQLRAAGVDVSAAPSGVLIFKRDTYKDRFLLKRFPLKTLEPAQPSLTELQNFGVDCGQGLVLGEESNKWLGLDDRVEVFEGGLTGMRGTIVDMRGETMSVKPDDPRIGTPIECSASELRKTFSEGERVRVMEGSYRDAVGLVVKANSERVIFTEDNTNREIEVLVRQVRLAENSAPAPASGGLRRGSVVKLMDDSVAVVMRASGATIRVLDAYDRERDVPVRSARSYSPPPRARGFPALDCEQNEVRARDKVLAIDGAHKEKTGSVLAVLHDKVFVETNDGGDRCLFVVPATHLRLQGGASDRQSMFLRQLDPASNLSVPCDNPQPASPGVLALTLPQVFDPRSSRRVSRSSLIRPTPPQDGESTPRADFGAFDRGLQRDPWLMGCVVSIITGPFKSCVGTVRTASRAYAQVELHSPRQIISVECHHLRVVEGPAGSGAPPRARSSSYNPRSTPYPTSSVGFYGSQIPLAPPRAPASPQPLPSPAFQGVRESPTIPPGFRTPASAITATPMYDAGSRTPLPTPQSPAPSAAVWEARATPAAYDSLSSSPIGYMSLPLEYHPPAPQSLLAPPPPPPPPPPPQLPAAWPRPGMVVTTITSPGVRETATIRAVTGEGGVTMMLRSGVLLTMASSENLLPIPPSLGDSCCVVVDDEEDGPGWGRSAILVQVVGLDGILRPQLGDSNLEMLPLDRLCRVTSDYVPPQTAVT